MLKYQIFTLLIFLLISPKQVNSQEINNENDTAIWTVMVYMNGCSELEKFAIEDFKEMAKVGSNKNLNIIVQMSRCGKHQCTRVENWKGILRYRITKGMIPDKKSAYKEIKQGSMGDKTTLENFITDVKNNYKANHYYLIIWDHGNHLKYATGLNKKEKKQIAKSLFKNNPPLFDKNNKYLKRLIKTMPETDINYPVIISKDTNKIMSLTDLENTNLNKDLDIIAFDTCLNSNIETAYSIRNKADFMIASQDYISGDGFNYEDLLSNLNSQINETPKTISKLTVDSYEREYKTEDNKNLSVISLTELDTTVTLLDKICDRIITLVKNSKDSFIYQKLKTVRSRCLSYEQKHSDEGVSIDMYTFLKGIEEELNDKEITSYYNELLQFKNNLVFYLFESDNYKTNPHISTGGISIYLPSTLHIRSVLYFDLSFATYSKWDELFTLFN